MALSVPTLPGILPVRYYVGEDSITICMGSYEVTASELTDDPVTFCADAIDAEHLTGWSVEVHGDVHMGNPGAVTDCAGIPAGQTLRLSPLSVAGYHVGLCPLVSAFDDLVARFGISHISPSSSAAGRAQDAFAPSALDAAIGRFGSSGTLLQGDTDVLVVEFQDALRETTAAILRRVGASVAEAESAEIAERILLTRDVKLVLLEPDLPFGGAMDLLESVHDLPPVIVFSAQPPGPNDQLRLGGKIVAYLQKPVAPFELIEVVRALLGKSEG